MRKTATPASTSRIRIPAPVALPAKRRSPTRRVGRGGSGGALGGGTDRSVCSVLGGCGRLGVGQVVPARHSGPESPGKGRLGPPHRRGSRPSAGRRDGVDRGLRLSAQVVRDGGAARGLGGGGLTVLADHVGLERLQRIGL